MARTLSSTVLFLAGTLAGMAGCQHGPQPYSSPADPGIEACPSRQFPSDYHPPAPPSTYFPGPLNSKTQVPPRAAPQEPAETPLFEEAPQTKPLPQEPRLQAPPGLEDGESPEDDSTAALRTEREQFLSQSRQDAWGQLNGPVQPVRLLQDVETSAAENELTDLQAQPIQDNPALQVPPSMYLHQQPGSNPICGVARAPVDELPPSYIEASPETSERPSLLRRLMQPKSKEAKENTAATPRTYR